MVYFLAGLAAAVATAFLTVKKDALTVPAALEAMVLILVSCWFGKWFGLAYLLIAYFSIALIDRVLKKKTAGIFSGINKKHGARDHIQVAANGFAAFVCILLYRFTDHRAFLIGFAVAIAQALADSVSSDVGVLSKSAPVSICTFKPVPRGLSGGVSLLGTLSGLAACLFCGGIYYLFFFDLSGGLFVVFFAFIGCLADSIIGDLLQEKFQCTVCQSLTEKTDHCNAPATHVSGIRHLYGKSGMQLPVGTFGCHLPDLVTHPLSEN